MPSHHNGCSMCPCVGVYLPLLWQPDFCWRSPVALAYTRGHFSALVPLENSQTPASPSDVIPGAYAKQQVPHSRPGVGLNSLSANSAPSCIEDRSVAWLPLIDAQGQLLPVHFLRLEEVSYRRPSFSLSQSLLDVAIRVKVKV